jgi:hypothetical protein
VKLLVIAEPRLKERVKNILPGTGCRADYLTFNRAKQQLSGIGWERSNIAAILSARTDYPGLRETAHQLQSAAIPYVLALAGGALPNWLKAMAPDEVVFLDSPIDHLRRRFARFVHDRQADDLVGVNELLVQTSGGIRPYSVDTDAIKFIRADGDYAVVETAIRTFLLRTTLSRLILVLDPQRFVRIHRSLIVAKAAVDSICPRGRRSRDILLKDGRRLPVGRTYRRNVKNLLTAISLPVDDAERIRCAADHTATGTDPSLAQRRASRA